jgi:hypothetical protein
MHLIIGKVSDLVSALNWHSVERKWAIDDVMSQFRHGRQLVASTSRSVTSPSRTVADARQIS